MFPVSGMFKRRFGYTGYRTTATQRVIMRMDVRMEVMMSVVMHRLYMTDTAGSTEVAGQIPIDRARTVYYHPINAVGMIRVALDRYPM